MSNSAEEYYRLENDEPVGPLTRGELDKLRRDGTLKSSDLVALAGSDEWVDYKDLPEAIRFLPPVPKPTTVAATPANVVKPPEWLPFFKGLIVSANLPLKRINLGAMMGALFLFALPWVDFQCSGKSFVTQSGLQTVSGGGSLSKEFQKSFGEMSSSGGSATSEPDAKERLPSAVLIAIALLVLIAAFVFSILSFRGSPKCPHSAVPLLSGIALVMVLTQILIGFPMERSHNEEMSTQAAGQDQSGDDDPFGAMGDLAGLYGKSQFRVKYTFALYLELLALGIPVLLFGRGVVMDRRRKDMNSSAAAVAGVMPPVGTNLQSLGTETSPQTTTNFRTDLGLIGLGVTVLGILLILFWISHPRHLSQPSAEPRVEINERGEEIFDVGDRIEREAEDSIREIEGSLEGLAADLEGDQRPMELELPTIQKPPTVSAESNIIESDLGKLMKLFDSYEFSAGNKKSFKYKKFERSGGVVEVTFETTRLGEKSEDGGLIYLDDITGVEIFDRTTHKIVEVRSRGGAQFSANIAVKTGDLARAVQSVLEGGPSPDFSGLDKLDSGSGDLPAPDFAALGKRMKSRIFSEEGMNYRFTHFDESLGVLHIAYERTIGRNRSVREAKITLFSIEAVHLEDLGRSGQLVKVHTSGGRGDPIKVFSFPVETIELAYQVKGALVAGMEEAGRVGDPVSKAVGRVGDPVSKAVAELPLGTWRDDKSGLTIWVEELADDRDSAFTGVNVGKRHVKISGPPPKSGRADDTLLPKGSSFSNGTLKIRGAFNWASSKYVAVSAIWRGGNVEIEIRSESSRQSGVPDGTYLLKPE